MQPILGPGMVDTSGTSPQNPRQDQLRGEKSVIKSDAKYTNYL